MKAKIIPITAATEANRHERLTNAAWAFARALLWQHQALSHSEVRNSKEHISAYLQAAPDQEQALHAFCERVALAERYLSAGISTYLPLPSVWLNPHYEHGFTATLPWLTSIREKQERVPGYMVQVTLIAEFYTRYVYRAAGAVRRCRRRLMAQRAYGMLQHFYNAIIHFNYLAS